MRLLRRAFPALGGAGGVGLVYLLYRNDWDVGSIGPLRLSRAGVTAAGIVVDYKWSLWGVSDSGSAESLRLHSAVHQRSAEALLRLACANGGVWIKVGQHLGALEYLLPKEYTRTLSRLHSDAPKSALSDVRRVIRHEFGKEVEEIFEEFAEHPIGAASLAQVHKARLRSNGRGRTVAVKVQHPRVKSHSAVDTLTMEVIVKVVARLFPEFKLAWLAQEMKKNLPVELNFELEGRSADRVRSMYRHLHFLQIPEVVWEWTTDRVLTMEFCEGGQVNDLDFMLKNNVDTNQVCRDIGRLYSEMIFVHGYVHCDPHPGNVLVQPMDKGHRIVLLDHGLYTSLNEEFRENYAHFWMSLLAADLDGIKNWAAKLGVGDLYGLFACMITARSWQSITKGVGNKNMSQTETSEIQRYVASLLPQISDVISRVPRPMILILKTNDLIRSIEHRLRTEGGAVGFLQMSRCCVASIRDAELRRRPRFLPALRIRLWAALQLGRLWLVATGLSIYARFAKSKQRHIL